MLKGWRTSTYGGGVVTSICFNRSIIDGISERTVRLEKVPIEYGCTGVGLHGLDSLDHAEDIEIGVEEAGVDEGCIEGIGRGEREATTWSISEK